MEEIGNMKDEVKEFISRLKTIKNKACDERVTVKTVYNRCDRGEYKMIEIDGVKFVLEEKD